MEGPHPFQATYSTSWLFSQEKRFYSEPVYADSSQSPAPTSMQLRAPRGLPPCFSHRKKRSWWACSSLYCTFSQMLYQSLEKVFSSHWGSSPIPVNIQRWQKAALYGHKPALSAALDAACFVPLICTGQVLSSNPWFGPCPLKGRVLLEPFH